MDGRHTMQLQEPSWMWIQSSTTSSGKGPCLQWAVSGLMPTMSSVFMHLGSSFLGMSWTSLWLSYSHLVYVCSLCFRVSHIIDKFILFGLLHMLNHEWYAFLNLKGFTSIVSLCMMYAINWLFVETSRPPLLVVLEKGKSWSKHEYIMMITVFFLLQVSMQLTRRTSFSNRVLCIWLA